MSLIPTELPFNLGSAIELPAIAPYGLTSLTPMNRLPFTLSALEPVQEVPYGSIGWEIVCRSHEDFQTEIFRTADMSPPSFSKELSATGLASVSFDLDLYLFSKLLNNGRPVEDLFDYENLWEIYFDKKLRFQFLGSAVREVPVDASEIRTASVSGNGIGQVLAWANVYPPNFPDVTRKLESLVDEFNQDRVDTRIWNMTTTVTGGIDIAKAGQKEELLALIEKLTADKKSAQEDAKRTSDAYDDELADYNAVYKDKTSTSAQKREASKRLNEAKAAAAKNAAILAKLIAQLADANTKNALAGTQRDNDTEARARLTIGTESSAKALQAGYFDIKSSGISARIEPLIQGAGGGQARTTFGVIHNSASYAYFYTASINGSRRLVAEVSDNSIVQNDDFSFNPDINSYWRIREDHRTIIFETSVDGDVWTKRFEANNVSWVDGSVYVTFKAELQGSIGLAPPLYAYISEINGSVIPAVDTVMAVFKEYLSEAQARGTIPYVSTEFTDLVDSSGASWVGKPNVAVEEGTDLLKMIQTFAQLQQFDWIMDNNFKLKVFQKVWNTNEADPTIAFHKEDKIVLHEANAQLTRERNRDRSNIGNSIVGKTASGEYGYVEDEESISKFQRREMFIEAGTAPDLATLGTVLQASLAQVKDEKSSWRLVVDPDIPNKRVFEDYDVGDWIGVEMVDSAGRATKTAWRVVGIAIQINADGDTTAELTLQSRIQLLAERLQQQVTNLGLGSSGKAGVSLGASVSAATLIEQALLSNLLDVSLPPSANRLPGDVLTWTGNYFTLTTPGDKTIPGVPEITGVASNVYYPESGTSTRAQVQIDWTTPLNVDGSTITDGHHYEVRYRPDTTLPYSATWEEAGQHLWNELYSWAQPTIPPIDNTGWQVIMVGFDDNQLILQELSPGVRYEFQIRAVDGSTPQHWSEWSESTVHEAAEDSIPPAQPAPPFVASSRLAVQVTHYLGKAEGGQFNLPPDLSHLEVHVGGPAFYPSDDTYVGKIVADVSILRGRTPVIQTFQVESTENIWVRVIAVDRTGNKSTPSSASTTQVNLIDDAHISDLTASKITAGIISSAIILSGSIKTAETGARAEMNFQGFRIFNDVDDDASVSLLSTPGINGNYLMIKDPLDSSATLAGIDGTGRGSFQSVTVSDDITIQGQDLLADIIDPRGKGIKAIGVYDGDPVVGAGPNIDRGFLEISFVAEESRTYMIYGITEYESTSGTNERMAMRLYDFGENTPVLPATGITRLQQSVYSLVGSAGVNSAAQIVYAGTFTPGLHRILWTFAGQLGNCTVNAATGSSVSSVSLLWVEDVGLPLSDTVIINDGGIDPQGTTASPDKPAAPTPKAQYTKTYSCTWSGTYRSNGDYSSSHGNTMVQGDSGADSWLNDARSLMGFNYSQIMNDLRGATIKACYVTLYANHWYWNDGGTARIGTHNYTSRPGGASSSRYSDKRISSANWPKPGKRKVSLGTTIGNEFKSGTTKGLMLGPTDGTKRQYGRFNGNGQSNEPVLTIVYIK